MTETTADSHDDPRIASKTRRAATETMIVCEIADDMYTVENVKEDDENTEYPVDLEEPACLCRSFEFQPGTCKHIRRVRMEIGTLPVPNLDEEVTVGNRFHPLDDETETDGHLEVA